MNKKNTKRKYYIIGAMALAVVFVAFFLLRKNDKSTTYITVEKKSIVQSVLAAGTIKAVDTVDLGFERSGRVVVAYVDVGSRVVPGQTLIELDSSELQADLLNAQANLAEESAVSATDTIAISDAIANAKVVIADSFIKADNIVRESVDQFFENPGGGSSTNFRPQIEGGGSSSYFVVSFDDRVSINTKRKSVQKKLDLWKADIAIISDTEVEELLVKSQTYLFSVRDLVDEVSQIIFKITARDTNSVSIVASFKTDISTARVTATTILSNLVSAQEKLNNAKAGGTQISAPSGSVSAQDARKLQLQAQIQNIQSQISKMKIRAPFAGVVTKQEVEQGEIVSVGETILSIISDNNLEIESNISEVNIGKVAVGNIVVITLDAFQGETFLGVVSYIDPGETIVDGVVNYKVKVALGDVDPKIKSGLTANLTLETGKKSDVVTIPLYAVTTKSSGTYVQKRVGEGVQETTVTLGIIGQDGNVEILNGLIEGDTIEAGQIIPLE